MSTVKFNKEKTVGIGPIDKNKFDNCECNRSALYIKTTIDRSSNRPLDILVKKGILKKISNVKYHFKTRELDITNTGTYNVYIFYRPLRDEREYHTTDPAHPKLVEQEDNPEIINENDCLKFAENLAYLTQNPNIDRAEFETLLQADSNPPFLQSKEGSITLGESNENVIRDNNRIIRKSKQKNDNAIPMAGELYGILRNKETIDRSDFHIAFVIFSDGKHNITLEASADAGNTYCPEFNMWDLNEGKTFHNHFSGNLYLENNPNDDEYHDFYTNGETVVLRLRNIAQIEQELIEENSPKPSMLTKRKTSMSPEVKSPRKTSRNNSRIGGQRAERLLPTNLVGDLRSPDKFGRGQSITKSKKKNNSSSRKK